MQEMDRRSFMKTTAAVSLGAIASQIAGCQPAAKLGSVAYVAGNDKIRIGLIGCGGRGTDAVRNCIEASESIELVAMADLFKDRLDSSFKDLKEGVPDKEREPRCREDSMYRPNSVSSASTPTRNFSPANSIWSC